MQGLIMTGQLLLAIVIMVGIHELGHLLFAKLFGMRVEQYSIGFPPKIFGKKIGETEYSIGMIPLGGFVKISGMIDESLDTKHLNAEPQPYEFRSKPAWQRLLVMLGGIIFNVITGIIVFIVITYQKGETFIPASELKNGIVAWELGQQAGLKTGDKIVNVNGLPYNSFEDLLSADVIFASDAFYTVARNDSTFKISIPKDLADKLSDEDNRKRFIEPFLPFVVAEVSPGTNADQAGILQGDQITAINGHRCYYFHEFKALANQFAGQKVGLTIKRGGTDIALDANFTTEGTLGFMPKFNVELQTKKYSLAQSVPVGTLKAFTVIGVQLKAIKKIFKGEISAQKSLSGPIRIAKTFGPTWDWDRFWFLIGLLSMVLAFMNLLPIPALDGGHVVFLTIEMISGKKPSDKVLETAQKIGMFLLLALMAFVLFNDIVSLFVK